MSQEGEKITLNIYDLSQGLARQLSASLLGKTIEGIWHTGVAVYGFEYYFGGGIQRTPVGQTPYGKPLKTVELGFTEVPKAVFEEFLSEISSRYTQATYNVLRHNCNNFSEEIVQFLVGSGIPEYILGLPNEVMNSPFGSMLLPMITQLENTLKHNQAPAFGTSSVPDFSGIQIPASADADLSQSGGNLMSPIARGVLASPATTSITANPEPLDSVAEKEEETELVEKVEKKSPVPEATRDALGDARVKVQEEITKEFTVLMASGSLRASEAAALAARRVMARHRIATN